MNLIERDYIRYAHDEIAKLLLSIPNDTEIHEKIAEELTTLRGWYMMTVVTDPKATLPGSLVLDAFDDISYILNGKHGMTFLSNFEVWLSNSLQHMRSKTLFALGILTKSGDGVFAYESFVRTVTNLKYKIGPSEYMMLKNIYNAAEKLLDARVYLLGTSETWEDVARDCLGTEACVYDKDVKDNI